MVMQAQALHVKPVASARRYLLADLIVPKATIRSTLRAKLQAQASIEYMVLIGFSLIVVSILWVTSGSNIENTQWDLQLSYAENSLDRIAQTVDSVYVQGQPAQTYINVDFPDNTNAVYLGGNSITLELRWKGILRNVTFYTAANMTGNINSAPGRHRLLVTAGSPVSITEA